MRHSNISIFVSHEGCPNKCAFCNQNTINGCLTLPTADDVREICIKALDEVKDRKNCEIAFFGGSFTAINREYMTSLLNSAGEFVGENLFKGIRISTRPDCIDEEILQLLKSKGVTAVELGAQSLDDTVLYFNDRGHTGDDVFKASHLVKSYGFELGLQIMTGLYKSTPQKDLDTMEKVIKIHPRTVRIYPTVVLEGTKLAQLYRSGEYILTPFDEMVKICGKMLLTFEKEDIKVIRCGLHASDNVEGQRVAGYYHPAFKEICESEIYKQQILKIVESNKDLNEFSVVVNDSCISKALGHKRSNYDYFKNKGIKIKIIGDKNTRKYECRLRR